MLEQMRRSSQSLLIYVLFGIVIAVFIISFGPQSVGGFGGPSGATRSWAAKVNGREVSLGEYRYAFSTAGGNNIPPQIAKAQRVREIVMDKIIERELFASEADRLGMKVSDEEVEDFIAQSKLMLFGVAQTIPSLQKDGHFDYEQFRRFVQYQGLTPRAFIEEQRRELLASRVRELVAQGTKLSEAEVRERWVREGNQVNLEYVRFPIRRYEEQVQLTDAEIAAYAKANHDKLQSLYKERKFLYEKVPRELKLRQILVKLDAGASKEAEAAAQKKADGLLAKAKKDGFAAVAKASSDDARTKASGGALGWKRQGATTLGGAVEEKVWAGKEGDVVGPVRGTDGFYLVAIEGAREGDLPFEKVEAELAENELRQDKAKGEAKQAAEAAVAKAKAATGKTLKDLFPPAAGDKAAASADAAPEAQETGLFSRRGSVVEGIGISPELSKQAFELTTEAPFAGPYEVAGSFVVARLKEKKSADLADFEKRKAELLAMAEQQKGQQVAAEWALARCSEARNAKRIDFNSDALRYDDGQEGAIPYQPCAPRSPFGF
jgi:peptidyl-prolyl cis-trans isomerase D